MATETSAAAGEVALRVRAHPAASEAGFYRCGMQFPREEWREVRVDAATAERLRREAMLEVAALEAPKVETPKVETPKTPRDTGNP